MQSEDLPTFLIFSQEADDGDVAFHGGGKGAACGSSHLVVVQPVHVGKRERKDPTSKTGGEREGEEEGEEEGEGEGERERAREREEGGEREREERMCVLRKRV